MQNSKTTNTENPSETCLIACPIFKKELESILQELNQNPAIQYMHYTIHNDPRIMDMQLREKVTTATNNRQNVRFLVGQHCKGLRDMEEVVAGCKGKIPQARNCIDMILGDKLKKKLEANRTSLMTPAWIRMITTSIADGQWNVTEARLALGWYNKILILDTGVDPLTDEQIMEFYDLVQVEIDIIPVELTYFKKMLQNLLQ